MTDILTSLLGRRKPKPPTPENVAHEAATSDDFVVVNGSQAAHNSSQYYSQPNNDYESLFSYLQVSQQGTATNGHQGGGGGTGTMPIRPAPPVPAGANGLPYPIHRSPLPASSTYADKQTSVHYLTGIPFQVSKALSDSMGLNVLGRLQIKSPDMSDYEYSFSLEMQVINESSSPVA